MFFYLLIIILLMILSFIFSGSETAFFAISKTAHLKLKQHLQKFPAASVNFNRIETILTKPNELLATILLSNLLANTSISSLFTLLIINLSEKFQLPRDLLISLGALLISIILITLCEILPKILAIRKPLRFALRTVNIINFLKIIFSFFTIPLNKLGEWLLVRVSNYIVKTPFPSIDDLKTIINLSEENGMITPAEQDFLFNLVDLSSRTVSSVMTPRIKMVCFNQETTIAEITKLISKKSFPLFSRIPIFQDNIDNITGILYLKDLITQYSSQRATSKILNQPIKVIARPPYFIPETKPLSSLLEELRKKDSHIAIVIDEYGQTAGLVTLEDILETMIGEIQDEYDTTEEMPYQLINPKTFLVSGDIDFQTLDQLFDNFTTHIPKQYGDRLSSFIYHYWGKIPKQGEILSYRNYRLEIKDLKKNRINKVLITKTDHNH